MRKLFIFCCLFCLAYIATAQGDVDLLIKQGIALHDKGDAEGAIAKYDAVLQQDPANYEAMYEKALSLMALKKYDDAEDLLKKVLKDSKEPQYRRLSYISYGSLLDYQGAGKKSIKLYDQGIKEFPDSYLLYFNKGVTQAGMNDTKDAIESFQLALRRNPYHASSHNALGRLMAGTNRIPAILSLITFLLIEPTGNRAAENTALLDKLIMRGIREGDGNSITINIDPSTLNRDKKNKEDDFSSAELILSLVAANKTIPDSIGIKTEADRLSYKLQLLFGVISETDKKDKGFFKNFYVPFFTEMKKNELVTIASYLSLRATDKEEITDWLKENKDDVDGFYRWFENYAWAKE